MKTCAVLSATLGLSLFAFSASAANEVVINEIMYHPFHTAAQAEDTGKEWIELYNPGTNTVNLAGWRLTKGVSFTFTNAVIAPGGYLVITASRTNFLATYPAVTNVIGDFSGHLGNTDDEVRLLNSIGEEVNRVAYADSGDWAVRARQSADAYGLRGWDWLAPHDGGGMTLELINPSMPNQYGQNWSSSVLANGTPGARNSVWTNDTAPFIQDVSYFPLIPRSTDSVAIKARIDDEAAEGITVTLFYRVASVTSPGPFLSLSMYDDGAHGDGRAGDGIFAAVVPPQPNNTVIEFYVAASDGDGRTRTWPAPARNAPDLGGGILPPENGANALYQVDNTVYTGSQPFDRMIMTEPERAFLASIAGALRNSDAAANGTFISVDPNGSEVHHLTGFRRRGAGTRGAAVASYRINFATDHRWHGVTAVNLNSQYTHSQVAGSLIAAMAGLNVEYQKPVQLRVNGVNPASTGSPQFGSFAQEEVPDGDYAARHFPDDPNGNLYRASSGNHAATLSYLGTDPNAYISVGYSKTSNRSELDWLDFIDLVNILNNTPDSNYVAAVRRRVNVEEWMTYFAVFTLLDSKETSLATGQGDDYEMYRGLINTNFLLLGHDFDTVFGQGDTAGNTADDIFRMTAVPVIDRFMKRPEFAPIYYRTLTNLLLTAFSPTQVGAALDAQLGNWVPGGVIANMKTFNAARNAGVMAQIPLNLTVSTTLGSSGGYPFTTSPSASLSGTANAITTRRVLVNGTNANWSAWNARWTATASLLPGINRILVQSLDENGVEFERRTIDVWYDRGGTTDVGGPINGPVIWTAANSPYRVTSTVSVPDEAQLIIEPGTTIYMAPGTSITVADTGYIHAVGTDTRHIHIGRQPGTTGNWGSLDFIGSSGDNRLAYVDFDSCGGTTVGGHNAQVHVNSFSTAFFDHCTWPPTPAVQYISFDNSSFIVQGCIFPTYPGPTGPEMLHGVNGIPAGGYGIFRDNYFGHTWGFNDTIDFTGGNRPGAILQIIGNVFDGASDDHLDLDSTDAWIEGNLFMHAHRDPARTDDARDTASAISGGVDFANQYSEWTIINNLFYDVDHAILNKGGGRFIFVDNTLVHVNKEAGAGLTNDISAFDWTDDGVPLPDPAVGAGAYIANNIIWDCPQLTANYNPANHTMIWVNNLLPSSTLNSQLSTLNSSGGSNNIVADPRLNLALITNATTADWKTVLAALTPQGGSPAIGTGYGAKYNRGAMQPPSPNFQLPSPNYGLLVFGEPQGTTAVNTATLTLAPGGTFNWGTNAYLWGYTQYKWKLDNGPWSGELPITTQPTITVSNLANGPHTVYVVGKNDAGYYQDDPFVYPPATTLNSQLSALNSGLPAHATASRTWFVDTTLVRVVLNEVLAKNVSALPVGGKYPDAIELYNAGSAAVDLGDMSLSDDPASPRKFTFKAGTIIPPGGYLVVYAGSGEAPGKIFTGFALNDAGEGVYLYDTAARNSALLDSVIFGLQLPDLSIGRLPDGSWGLTRPTFGGPNIAQPLGDPTRLKINEWLAAEGLLYQDDFIELFNPDSLPVALGGLALSDSPMGDPRMSVIPPLSFIAANGWQSFTADADNSGRADHVNFKLTADGGWISLANIDGTFIDFVVYVTQLQDISMGRSPDGAPTFVSFNQPTPGGGNPGQTIVVTPINTTLVPIDYTWRMEASGVDLGTAWRAPSYNDASWTPGRAMFYNFDGSGTQVAPLPINTVVPFTNPKQLTVYFRTAFTYNGPTTGVSFALTHAIDDGCVLYLNGQEVYRYNISPSVVVGYSTLASPGISGAPSVLSGIPISLPNLVQGTNYLAIEVHQQSQTSSDIAMAVQIDAQQFITNYLSIPVVLNEVFTKNQSYTNAAGKAVDWVELYNPSTNTVDISDLSLTDDPTRPRRWTFPQGAVIPPGGYYVVEFDDSAPYSPVNAGFELSADSGALYLFHRPSAGGALLDSVVYGVQVADLTLGRAAAGLNSSWTLCRPTRGAANAVVTLGNPAALRINEWMPNPDNGDDDWFELYNTGSQPVALAGLHLTDDLSNPIKHTIRPLSFIGSGRDAWVKFIADNDVAKGADHVAFKMDNNAESIGLYTTNAVPTAIDAITYTNAQNGVSQGRLPDGSATIVNFTNSASPGDANWLPLAGIVINEALARPNAPLEQAIEIRNPGEVDFAIGGWFLSNAQRDLKRYRIPAGTVVPAGGFKVFYESQFNPSNNVPPSFALNASQSDQIYLSVADANGNLTGYRATVDFGASAPGVSFGRYEKSTGDDFVAMSATTFGNDNAADVATFRAGQGAANAYPVVGPLVVNEINYHPPGVGTNDDTLNEFIEIYNISGSPVSLFDPLYPTNSWRLRSAVDFDFPTNLTLPAGGFVVVVSFDPATNAAVLAFFRGRFNVPAAVPVIGPWNGKLDNSGEAIELSRPDAPLQSPDPDAGRVPYILVDRVKYSDAAPWPSAADGVVAGVGLSLQRRVAARYGNDATNWAAATPTPGTANAAPANTPPVVTAAPTDVATGAGSNITFRVTATGAAPLIYQWRFNGILIAAATNATLTLSNVQSVQAGRYSVVVANPWGAALGGPARLSVQAPPQIAQQPLDRTAVAGEDASFVVTASGGALQYQWRFYGTNLPGATSALLAFHAVSLADSGPYSVVISNSLGSVTSAVATLTVLVPPSITAQPQSRAIIVGNPVTFSVSAIGTTPMAYQWQHDGAAIVGADNPTLTLTNVQVPDGGSYVVVVTNAAGSITSAVATLTVIVPPTVTVEASDPFASEPGTDTGTFTFTRTGDTSSSLRLSYSVSGTAIPASDYSPLSGAVTIAAGASSTNVAVVPLNDSLKEGDESVIVALTARTNYLVGSPSTATVTIFDDDNQRPLISITAPHTNDVFVLTPTNVPISVATSDPDGSIVKVEFFANGTNKLGETTSPPFNFTWTNAPAGTNALTARATDNLGSTATSEPVVIVLNALPTIAIIGPVSGTTFSAGANIGLTTFAADPDGSISDVTFYANGSAFAVATASPFGAVLTNATVGIYSFYAVAVDDRGASSTSAVVSVTVNQPGLFDDFEPDIDRSQWSAFGGVLGTDVIATNYGGSVSGTHALWFGGEVTRSATTRPVNATPGGVILFQLRISNGGQTEIWEMADLPGEGVVLEYSVNGGSTWVNIGTFDTAGANYTQGWVLEQFSIPVAAQTASTLFRWRQLSHSGGCCDHWAIDDVQIITGPTPPNIGSQPSGRYTVAGSTVTFNVGAYGSAPFWYQWRFNNTDIPNATNATLTLTGVTTNQSGLYSVVITNAYGAATSSNALLTVVEANSEYFRVVAMTANNVTAVDHYSTTGYDPLTGNYGRGGIAVSPSQVIVNSGARSARFSALNLTSPVAISNYYDGLITDLRSQKIYVFATNATGPALSSQNSTTLSHLIELNPTTGLLTTNVIQLSYPITLRGAYGNYGFFSGYGRVAIAVGQQVYHISLPSGAVAAAGRANITAHNPSENWGYWGLLESTDTGLALVYARDSQTIVRAAVGAVGAPSVLATFSNLGYYLASISFSVPRSRWYFDYMYSAQFYSGTEVVGFGDAEYALEAPANLAPAIIVPPQNDQTLVGGRAAFSVTALGTEPISYQWRFNDSDITGQTLSSLSLTNVQFANLGAYRVVVSNAFGSVTTAPVTLSTAAPPVITTPPASQTVLGGAHVTLTVAHTGDGPFLYQWRFNGSDLYGATNQTFDLPSAGFYDNGQYSVEVRNAVGGVVSASARLTVYTPPFFTSSSRPIRQVLRGMTFSLVNTIDGTTPYSLRWDKDGVPLSSTNWTYSVTNAQPADAGTYRLIVTNIYGSVTTSVTVAVLELDDDSFAVVRLGTNNAVSVNAYNQVGYLYYNGIAASFNRLFLNGYGTSGNGAAASYSAADLSDAVTLNGVRYGLVSDLRARKVYSLGAGTNMIGYGGTVNSLIGIDDAGQPTTNVIALSTNINMSSYSAVFAGYGRIVLMDGNSRVWDIGLPSGKVTNLGTMQNFPYVYAYGFAYRGWGVAEHIGTNTWLVHAADYQTIVRTHVPDGDTEVVGQFSNLGSEAGNFTVCLPRNRWYFNNESSSQFPGTSQNNLISASASFVYRAPTNIPASILEQPANSFPQVGSTLTLGVVADGGALRYQWRFQGDPIPGETNATLVLTNVHLPAEGGYSVVVSNALAVVTSAVANVTINYGASSSNSVSLLTLTGSTWRFNQTAVFANSSWTGSNYNDSTWPAGRALLAWETANATVQPLTNTWLTIGRTSYYFRTWFNLPTNVPAGTLLRATTMIDDGAVIFINGREVQRVRMTSGSYNYNTFANAQPPGGDAVQEFFYWPATNLVAGSNVVAAEVHQASATSSDIVWGMALDAFIPVLNRPPLITSHPVSRTVSNGVPVSFTVAATGTGPFTYEWTHDGAIVPGAAGTTLNIPSAQPQDGGVYVAHVTNPFDTAVSSNATLVVLVPLARFISGAASFTAPGQFTLRFVGDPNTVFAIQSSTNLIDWTQVGTVTNTTGTARFDDPTAGSGAYRFYRLKLLP